MCADKGSSIEGDHILGGSLNRRLARKTVRQSGFHLQTLPKCSKAIRSGS